MSTLTSSAPQGAKGTKSNKRKKNSAKKTAEESAKREEQRKVELFEAKESDDTELLQPVEELDVAPRSTSPPHALSNGPKLENSERTTDEEGSSATALVENESDGLPRKPLTNGSVEAEPADLGVSDVEMRLEELSVERQSLQAEVKSLRESLEEIQEKHKKEIDTLRSELEDAESGKDQAETQYRNLLGKLNTIRSQLGERLKADAEELSKATVKIEELEENNKVLQESNESLQAQLVQLHRDDEQRSKELSSLRNRMNLSQQNWLDEREALINREALVRDEFEAAKQAMQDWEVLAMEERSIRQSLAERVSGLEEQLASQKEAYVRAASERDNQSLTVDGLQRALQDLQDARKLELRELVDSNQAQVESLRKEVQETGKRAEESQSALEKATRELERALPFEKEVKEKNLLIGKLRHEAVILNDHLTKALRVLRKGRPEDNIDRHIVTNHFLHFLALDRADPKKFQVLQLIAALLNWTEEQREQAGLSRPGTSSSNLRVPLSPFHRTPSTPVMATEFFPESPGRKESLAELWSNFLEQEAKVASSGTAESPKASSPRLSSG